MILHTGKALPTKNANRFLLNGYINIDRYRHKYNTMIYCLQCSGTYEHFDNY